MPVSKKKKSDVEINREKLVNEWREFASLFNEREWRFMCSDRRFLNAVFENIDLATDLSVELLKRNN